MRLSLVVPDILWGGADDGPLFDFIDALPAARRLAAQAPSVGEYHAAEAVLAASCGLQAESGSVDLAALRLRGEGTAHPIASERVLCADPVNFRFHQEFLIAADDSQVGLSEGEAQELVAALNAHFGERARFTVAAPGRWYVEFPAPAAGSWPPLPEILGRSLAPRLFDPPALQQLGSEAQMLLHAHPVNAARDEAGRPTANGVWLWGGQSIDPGVPRTEAIPTRLVGKGPLLRGLAEAISGALATDARQANGGQPADSATLVFVDTLRAAATYESAEEYRNAWQEFSADWLEPSLAAWNGGVYDGVEIISPCPTYGTLVWRWSERPGLLGRLRTRLLGRRSPAGLQALARRLANREAP